MQVEQRQYKEELGWSEEDTFPEEKDSYQLVLGFGSSALIKDPKTFNALKEFYPNAEIVLSSTCGEIFDVFVDEDTVSSVAVRFDKTKFKIVTGSIDDVTESFELGKKMTEELYSEDLKHIILFSDGLGVNATDLVEGMTSVCGENVGIAGGLAGDGRDFKKTYVSYNEIPQESNNIVMVALYGSSIQVGRGSVGGWDTFGILRNITKSQGNTLYEIDGEPALDLYKRYLGELAKDLPSSGLNFPLSINKPGDSAVIVRTLLSVNEENKSVTFAGDVPEGYEVQLMKANFDRIVDGAGDAATKGLASVQNPKFALLISCAGRKWILNQRTEEEVENVRYMLGDGPKMAGFYSYGEVGPSENSIKDCKLHNQTMTLTVFGEDE